jgi:hypothetical protein
MNCCQEDVNVESFNHFNFVNVVGQAERYGVWARLEEIVLLRTGVSLWIWACSHQMPPSSPIATRAKVDEGAGVEIRDDLITGLDRLFNFEEVGDEQGFERAEIVRPERLPQIDLLASWRNCSLCRFSRREKRPSTEFMRGGFTGPTDRCWAPVPIYYCYPTPGDENG